MKGMFSPVIDQSFVIYLKNLLNVI